jgi:cytochrome c-type biogenesis protein CcmE
MTEVGRGAASTAVAPRRPLLPMRFLVGGAVVLLAVTYLAYVSLGTATVYYLTVGELQARGPSAELVRVAGQVEPGSIVREAAGRSVRFVVSDGAARLPVTYGGVVPDIFAGDVEVVVEGRYTAAGDFRATNLLTKCPSRFEG